MRIANITFISNAIFIFIAVGWLIFYAYFLINTEKQHKYSTVVLKDVHSITKNFNSVCDELKNDKALLAKQLQELTSLTNKIEINQHKAAYSLQEVAKTSHTILTKVGTIEAELTKGKEKHEQ